MGKKRCELYSEGSETEWILEVDFCCDRSVFLTLKLPD
jgi:hypothetical protein